MTLDIVLDIGTSQLKGAFFQEGRLKDYFSLSAQPVPLERLKTILKGKDLASVLLSSVNSVAEQDVKELLQDEKIPFYSLDFKDLNIVLDIDEPQALGHDRIANIYGALFHFPHNDCIIVDIGNTVTFDYAAKEGRYIGGAIYPGIAISIKVLTNHATKLPILNAEKPTSPLGKTTEAHIQSGIYYGLLGAIERIVAEMRSTSPSPSSIQIIATGEATEIDEANTCTEKMLFIEDLKEIVDFIDPHLTLVGLHEILKEYVFKKKEK
jgi:type III pantothenate kinase